MDPPSDHDRPNAVYGHRSRPLAPRGVSNNWDENQVQASRHVHPRGGYFEPEDPNLRSDRPAPSGQATAAERARSQTLQQPASNRVQRHHPYPTPSTARGPEFSRPLVPESNSLRQRPTFSPGYNFGPNSNRNPPVESVPRPLVPERRQIDPLDYLSQPYTRDENRAPAFSHQGVHGFRRPSSSRYPFIPRPQQRSVTTQAQHPTYNPGSTQPPEYNSDTPRHLEYSTMEAPAHLDPSSAVAAFSKQKSEAMRLAREQASAVKEMCRRAKSELPPYTFEELIGKGSYGRVYKGRQLPSNSLVAIKVMDIDKLDYTTTRDFRDESIKDFIHETKVMKQVKDSGAKNINMLIESVSIHSQLWLVCEYCPGGSVKTLMRAMDDKLSEKFIIPVARELAEGLNAIHKAGIIHRDIKAANVLIHEEGRLQICDFGVAGVLQSQLDKRSTWIGTPHWMPPELFPNRPTEAHQYGSEVDVWAYGCTLFECVMGNPPNASLRERIQIGRQLNRVPPRLEEGKYSVGVTSLVAYALEADPTTRPSMEDILQHSYIAESTESHPTDSLRELVRIYYQWTQRGGQRISLFNPGGAVAAEMPEHRDSLDGETWNFSTTDGFQKRFSLIDLDQITESLAALDGERTPTTTHQPYETPEEDEDTGFTLEQRANFDERVKRGAEAMEGLFDEGKPDYKYETKNDFVPIEQNQRNSSDLPLRTDTDRSSVTSTFIDIDLGVYDSARYASAAGTTNPPFQLADAGTIRANRSSSRLFRHSSSAGSEPQEDYDQTRGPRPPTMDWTFPAMSTEEEEDPVDLEENGEEEIAPDDDQSRGEKRDTRAWTFPVMTEEDGPAEEPNEPERGPLTAWGPGSEGSIEGLSRPFPLQRPPMGRDRNGSDLGPDGDSAVRPTTSASSVSDADTDPFRFDREINQGATLDRVPSLRDFSVGEEEDHGSSLEAAILRNGNFTSYPGVQSESSSIYSSDERGRVFPAGAEGRSPLQFPSLRPPTMESLSEGASEDVIASELDRMFGGFLEGLLATHEAITSADSGRSAEFDQRDNA